MGKRFVRWTTLLVVFALGAAAANVRVSARAASATVAAAASSGASAAASAGRAAARQPGWSFDESEPVEQAQRRLVAARPDPVARLYASAIELAHEGEAFAVFVGFTGAPEDGADARDEWIDLRDAGDRLTGPWGPALRRVRADFVASPPDEALRVR